MASRGNERRGYGGMISKRELLLERRHHAGVMDPGKKEMVCKGCKVERKPRIQEGEAPPFGLGLLLWLPLWLVDGLTVLLRDGLKLDPLGSGFKIPTYKRIAQLMP